MVTEMSNFIVWTSFPIAFTEVSNVSVGAIQYNESITSIDVSNVSVTTIKTLNQYGFTWGAIGDGVNYVFVTTIAIGW